MAVNLKLSNLFTADKPVSGGAGKGTSEELCKVDLRADSGGTALKF